MITTHLWTPFSQLFLGFCCSSTDFSSFVTTQIRAFCNNHRQLSLVQCLQIDVSLLMKSNFIIPHHHKSLMCPISSNLILGQYWFDYKYRGAGQKRKLCLSLTSTVSRFLTQLLWPFCIMQDYRKCSKYYFHI